MTALPAFERRIAAAFAARPKQAAAYRDALLVEGLGHLSEAEAIGDTVRAEKIRAGLAAVEGVYLARRPRRNNRRNRSNHRKARVAS